MAYQFLHIETYSRKCRPIRRKKIVVGISKEGRTVDDIFDEAERVPDACLHVKNPSAPTVVFGMSVSEARAYHDAVVDDLRDAQGRKIRATQNTLLAGVVSYPANFRDDKYQHWEDLNLKYLRETYGDELVSVVRHDDESHPHLHFFVVPKNGNARLLNPGIKAKLDAIQREKEAGNDKFSDKESNVFYKQAMREMQDNYFRKVGVYTALQRIGPGRRRLKHAQYKQDCANAELLADVESKANEHLKNAEITLRDAKVYALNTTIEHKQKEERWEAFYDMRVQKFVSERDATISKLSSRSRELDAEHAENDRLKAKLDRRENLLIAKEKQASGFLHKFKKRFATPDFSKVSELVDWLKSALRKEMEAEMRQRESNAYDDGYRRGLAGRQRQIERKRVRDEKAHEVDIPQLTAKIERELGLEPEKPRPVAEPPRAQFKGPSPF